jgi:cbb3-type cytochrome oxidase subunit 3
MGLQEAFETAFLGIILVVVILNVFSVLIPQAQGTIDNAATGAFGMGGASKTMLGLLGFFFICGFAYLLIKKTFAPDDRTRYDGTGNGAY